MTEQPNAPAAPAAPSPRVEVNVPGNAGNAMDQAARRMDAAAERMGASARRMGGDAGQSGNTGVVKDGGGRIVVTGPDGKTVTIDPKVGLNADQVQEMVQTALQPARPPSVDEGPSHNAVSIVGIIFSFLFAVVWLITRAVRRRPAPAGAMTAALAPEAADRLARIEQAVEAVAIEVERISEAQRYSAQLLTERLRETVPAIAGARAEARSVE